MKSEHRKRGRRPLDATERKDRIVQARVPEELDDALREAAEERQISVSQLVRNLLEDTFQLVDNIVADSASLVDGVKRDARKIAASAKAARSGRTTGGAVDAQIDAWQAAITNRAAHCHNCHNSLPAGSHAWLASGPALRTSIWRCADCAPDTKKQ
jgi:hypothetical protein